MDHDRLPELGGKVELRGEDAALLVSRRVVAEEVEPDLADGNGLGRDHAPRVFPVRRLVRMDAGGDVHPVLPLRDLARRPGGDEPRSDRDHALHAGGTRSFECARGVLQRIEVRVRVDHEEAMRASSSSTTLGSSFLNSGRGSPSCCPAGSSLGAHAPTQDSYSPVRIGCVEPSSSTMSRSSRGPASQPS